MLNQDRASASQNEVIETFRTLRHGWGLLIALVWLFGPSTALVRGQSYLQSAGSPKFSTQIPIENGYIDASNGRLHLEIPMGSFPQRGGHSYNVSLNYDSNIWASTSGTWQPTNVPNAGCGNSWSGWRIVTPSKGCLHYTETDTGYCNGFQDRSLFYQNWIYTAPDGTVHSFPNVSTEEQGDTCSSAINANSQGWASDGSGFWLAVVNYIDATVYAPDGTQVYGNGWHGPEDSNGNYVDGGGGGGTVIGDTLGRVPVTTAVNGSTFTYTLSNAQGNTGSVYTVTTSTISAKTNFGQTGVGECTTSCTLTIVRSIKLPDNTTYTFQYDCDSSVDSTDCSSPHAQSNYYGLLTRMTLPTGGTIQYSWQPFTDSQGNHYEWINTLITPDSSTGWTFTPQVATTCGSGQINCQQTFKVIKPNGDETLYTSTLNGGAWASKVDTYNQTTTLLSTVTQCWQYVAPITSGTCVITGPTTGTPVSQVQKLVSSTTLPTPTGSVSKTTQFIYDSYGNTTKIQENNWYTGTLPSAVDRTTTIAYLNGTSYLNALILNRPTSVTVTNAGGGTIAQTNYCYDYSAVGCGGSGFVSVTGATNHDDANYGSVNNVRGDLTQVKRLISGTTNFLTTSVTYDTTGQVRTSTDSKGNVTTYSYTDNYVNGTPPHPTNAYPTTITKPLSLSQTSTYYFGTGQVASSTDANGKTISFSFADVLNRLTSTSLPNNGWTLTQYNSTDTQVDSYLGIAGTIGTGCTTCRHDETKMDSLGRPINSYLISDPDGTTEVDTQYDSNGRLKTISNPYRSVSDSTYGLETPTYDGLDRAWKVTHADGNVAYTYYGAAITGTLGQTTQQCLPTSTYGLGYPVLVVDEAGNKRESWTDGFGRVIETDEPTSSGSLTAYTCNTYDLNNNLIGVTATGGTQSRSYAYDMLSRVTSKTNPETGAASFYYTTTIGGSTLCSGDPTAVCLRKDARNITTTYTYDALNRLTQMSYNDSSPTTPTVTYSYDQTSYNGLTITNGKGRRTGMSDGSGQTAWSYDSVGNVLAEARTINGQTKTINYTYNLDGSIKTIQYPGIRTVTYAEGNAQRMTAAQDTGNTINYATSATYAPQGALASVQNGSSVVSTMFYNNRLELCRISIKNTGTAPTICSSPTTGNLMDLTYGYVSGNNGNIASQTNNSTSGRTQTYTYDPLNRLLTAQAQATSPSTDCWGQSFGNGGPPPTMATDALANLFYTTSIKCSSPAPQITVNAGNNQFTGGLISYDADGDMTQDNSPYTYTYDSENRIITASGMTNGPYCYTYDGNGMRVKKAHASGGSCTGTVTVDMLYWRNIVGKTIAETDGTGSTTNSNYNEYVFFAGRRIAQSNPSSGNVYYYFADHLGSTRVVTTATGTACFQVDYLPYGSENTPSGFSNTCSTRYRFTGYERDLETAYGTSAGNDYAFARYYNSRLGRFMSGDPLDGDISDPQTLNKYAYVRDNPANLIDPMGLRVYGDNPEPYVYGDLPEGTSVCPGVSAAAVFGGVACDPFRYVAPPLPPWLVPPPPPKPKPSASCLNDLKTAGQNAQALNNASNNWVTLMNAADSSGISTSLLAAIGVRESGFRNINENDGAGVGVGVFQITVSAASGVTLAQAGNLTWAANYASNMLATNMRYLGGKFPNFNAAQLLQATAASYNFGTSNISGNPNTIDVGTAPTGHGNYGSNVLNIMKDCFD